MIDSSSPEFRAVLDAWLGALKVLDTKLNAFYMAVASLENDKQLAPAASHFKDVLLRCQESPKLATDMNHKYSEFLLKWEQLAQQSDFSEALASWLQEFRLKTPEIGSVSP